MHDILYLNTFEACLKLLLTLQSGMRLTDDLNKDKKIKLNQDTKVFKIRKFKVLTERNHKLSMILSDINL